MVVGVPPSPRRCRWTAGGRHRRGDERGAPPWTAAAAARVPPPAAPAVGRGPASLPVVHDADGADRRGSVTATAETLDLFASVEAAVAAAAARRRDPTPRPAVRAADDGGDPLGWVAGICESLDMLDGVTGITESLLTSHLSDATPDASRS